MKAEHPAVAHRHADVPALQKPLRWIRFASCGFHVEPEFWLAGVLASVEPSLVRSSKIIEGHDIHRGRAEKSELQIVRHQEVIVGRMPSAQSQSLCRLAVLLLLLLWPREEEAARSPEQRLARVSQRDREVQAQSSSAFMGASFPATCGLPAPSSLDAGGTPSQRFCDAWPTSGRGRAEPASSELRYGPNTRR